LEDGRGIISRDVLPCHTEDTISLGSNEAWARDGGQEGESLGFDDEATEVNVIRNFEARSFTSSVLDDE